MNISKRVLEEADYILKTGNTIREIASVLEEKEFRKKKTREPKLYN